MSEGVPGYKWSDVPSSGPFDWLDSIPSFSFETLRAHFKLKKIAEALWGQGVPNTKIFRGHYANMPFQLCVSGLLKKSFEVQCSKIALPTNFSLKDLGSYGKADDVQLGDPAFDARFFVQSKYSADALSVLTPEVRKNLCSLPETKYKSRPLDISGNTRTATLTLAFSLNAVEHVKRLLEALVGMALAHKNPKGALIENLNNETSPEGRMRLLAALCQAYANDVETTKVLNASNRDPDPGVRVFVSVLSKDPNANALVSQALEADTANSCVRAVRILGEKNFPMDPLFVGDFLTKALSVPTSPAFLSAAAHSLGHIRYGPGVETLIHVYNTNADFQVCSAVVRALAQIGDARAEEVFIRAVERNWPEIELIAIEALGRVGTLRAIAPLIQLGEDPTRDKNAMAAANKAVARIQSRIGDRARGGLFIEEDPSMVGALSPALEGGEVSPASSQDGQAVML